jgi:hypothetical protein
MVACTAPYVGAEKKLVRYQRPGSLRLDCARKYVGTPRQQRGNWPSSSTVPALVEGVLSVAHLGLPTKPRGSHRQNPLQMGCKGAAAPVLSENPIALLSRHLRKPGGSGSPSAECDDVGQVAGSGPFPTSLSVASSSLSLS